MPCAIANALHFLLRVGPTRARDFFTPKFESR
jgi:hypothetical protein